MRRRQALSANPGVFAVQSRHLRTDGGPALAVAQGRDLARRAPEPLSWAVLAAMYEAQFKRKPHRKMKRETMLEKLNDAGN